MTALVSRTNTTLADAILKRDGRTLTSDAALVVLFAGITALAAQIRIPLPFTPVPITGQTFAVLLAGAALGARRGATAMVLYVACGAFGLPFYAGGTGGCAHIFGPTGGYLLSYPLAAAAVGVLAEHGWDRKVVTTACAMLAGSFIIYLCGVSWLAFYVGGLPHAIVQGCLPFLPGDAIKAVLAALALPGAWKVARR